MAKNCALCGKGLSFFNSTSVYYPYTIPVCFDCYDLYNDVLYTAKNIINYEVKIAQLKKRCIKSSDAEAVVEYFDSLYENAVRENPDKAEKENLRLASECENTLIEKQDKIDNYSYVGPFTDKPYVYSIEGVRGKSIVIYNDKVVITTKVTLGSLIAHNATDGEKTIYYSDCIGVQFKESKATIGYLQLETAASSGNNSTSNFFNENSFTFDTTVISNEKMKEVADFVKGKIDEIKSRANAPAPAAPVASNLIADELLKLKQLVDMGVLTQEEFDMQKKKLLGL